MFAKCNNQPNKQMGYVGEMQQSTSKQINIISEDFSMNKDKPILNISPSDISDTNED